MDSFNIILLALVAVFIFLRLRSVLGTRDGNEGERTHRDPFRPQERQSLDDQDVSGQDNVVHLPQRENAPAAQAEPDLPLDPEQAETPLDADLIRIRQADSNFDPNGFLSGARWAFEMILGAFANGDRKTLEGLLDTEVYENFAAAIDAREDAEETLENTLVGIKEATITEASLEGSVAYVTCRIVSEQVNDTKDSEGRIIDGDPNTVETITDLWTFMRDTKSSDPTWFLVATETP